MGVYVRQLNVGASVEQERQRRVFKMRKWLEENVGNAKVATILALLHK